LVFNYGQLEIKIVDYTNLHTSTAKYITKFVNIEKVRYGKVLLSYANFRIKSYRLKIRAVQTRDPLLERVGTTSLIVATAIMTLATAAKPVVPPANVLCIFRAIVTVMQRRWRKWTDDWRRGPWWG